MKTFEEMQVACGDYTSIRQIGPRAIELVGSSPIGDDEIQTITGVMGAETTVWDAGCDTCGYGWRVEVGFNEDIRGAP